MNPENTMRKRIDEAYLEYGEIVADLRRDSIAYFHAHKLIQSPIEVAMAQSLLIMNTGFGWEYDGALDIQGAFTDDKKVIVQIVPQQSIGIYKVDFAIRVRDPNEKYHFIAVECDGHDFHEKTKQQAAHDKKRDRFIQSQGYQMYRFTGSEIYRDPIGCVDEIGKVISEIVYPRRPK